MANHASLKDARLKLEWAKGYLRELNLAVAAFRQAKPYTLLTEHNPKTHEVVVRAKLNAAISTDIQRLVGNIVTDLRSALDYTVCELAVITDGDSDRRGVEFPIAPDRAEFEKSTTQKKKAPPYQREGRYRPAPAIQRRV